MKYIPAICLILFAAPILSAAELETAVIRLSSDPTKALAANRGKALEASTKRSTEFQIVPGLTNPSLVSLKMKTSARYYVRHQNFVLYLHEHEKGQEGTLLFEADATFKLLRSADGKVRFESSNYPGHFITVNGSGTVAIVANSAAEQSTFTLDK
jgi:hypothetical protein